jgi:hypothetical protein
MPSQFNHLPALNYYWTWNSVSTYTRHSTTDWLYTEKSALTPPWCQIFSLSNVPCKTDMFRHVCCSECHLTTCSLLRWYSVNDRRIRVIKYWWNDTTLVGYQVKMEWYKTRSLVNMEETTLVKWAGVWVKGQRNINIIWKNGTLTSQNPHYMPVRKDKSLAGHGLVF